MARKFQEITHPIFGSTTQSYVETKGEDRGGFFAKVGGIIYRNKDFKLLEKQIHAAMKERTDIKWIRFIEIKIDGPGHWDHNKGVIKTIYDRKKAAIMPDGRWVISKWDTNNPLNNSQYSENVDFSRLPISVKRDRWVDEYTHYVSYDEKIWRMLNWVSNEINKLREMLGSMISNPDGRIKLTQASKGVKSLEWLKK
ncbi:hypothetical protein KAR91_21445 [Candidatus Pacearchaeota archaeon]|nr:hypothetical protein [Candidatus Pacearchaeota archaeon]